MKRTLAVAATALMAAVSLGCAPISEVNAQGAPAPGAAPAPERAGPPMGRQPGMRGMQGRPGPGAQERRLPGEHIEGWLAFLKAEIKITAAQEKQWARFAQTARELTESVRREAQEAQAGRQARRDQVNVSLPERLKQREARTAAQLDRQRKVGDAIEPLYKVLTAEQQRVADEFIPRVLGPAGGDAGPRRARRGIERPMRGPGPMQGPGPMRAPGPPPSPR